MKHYQPGDRVTGRCTTNGTCYTGTVSEVIHPAPLSGQYGPRYRLTNTGQHYHGGNPVEPIVETADRVPGSVVTIAAGMRQFDVTEQEGDMVKVWPRNPRTVEEEVDGRWVSEGIVRAVPDGDVEPYDEV